MAFLRKQLGLIYCEHDLFRVAERQAHRGRDLRWKCWMESRDVFGSERSRQCVDYALRAKPPARCLYLDLATGVTHGTYVGTQSHVAARSIGRDQRAIALAHSP